MHIFIVQREVKKKKKKSNSKNKKKENCDIVSAMPHSKI